MPHESSHHGVDRSRLHASVNGSHAPAKDPSYNDRCPGKSVACVITEAEESHFAKWQDKSQVLTGGQSEKRRGEGIEEYKACKTKFQEKLVSSMCRHYPQIKGKIDFVETGSPLTQRYYYGRAASYGRKLPPPLSLTHTYVHVHVHGRTALDAVVPGCTRPSGDSTADESMVFGYLSSAVCWSPSSSRACG